MKELFGEDTPPSGSPVNRGSPRSRKSASKKGATPNKGDSGKKGEPSKKRGSPTKGDKTNKGADSAKGSVGRSKIPDFHPEREHVPIPDQRELENPSARSHSARLLTGDAAKAAAKTIPAGKKRPIGATSPPPPAKKDSHASGVAHRQFDPKEAIAKFNTTMAHHPAMKWREGDEDLNWDNQLEDLRNKKMVAESYKRHAGTNPDSLDLIKTLIHEIAKVMALFKDKAAAHWRAEREAERAAKHKRINEQRKWEREMAIKREADRTARYAAKKARQAERKKSELERCKANIMRLTKRVKELLAVGELEIPAGVPPPPPPPPGLEGVGLGVGVGVGVGVGTTVGTNFIEIDSAALIMPTLLSGLVT